VIVIDASLAVKIFLDEPGTEDAINLVQAESGRISAPDVFTVEVASTLVREANSDKLNGEAMRKKLAAFTSLVSNGAITLVRSTGRDIENAANLAIDLGHPLKDCIYLALAMDLGCDLVTCDARFAVKAKGVWDRVRVLDRAP
jgi:predicted nucleic acid-binding protein